MNEFRDHFSGHASQYSKFRPVWPLDMFAWLAEQSPVHDLAWDCATGNGQAALALKAFYRKVIATDASKEQIQQAVRINGVDYRVEQAEKSSLPTSSADLLVVAQAYHWFDHGAFLKEADRVLKPGGLLAIASYQLISVNNEVDQIVHHFWGEVLDGWWPPERAMVDQGFGESDLPYAGLHTPAFEIAERWQMSDLLNYLGTWSAVRRYMQSKAKDPLELIADRLQNAWGDSKQIRTVRWPVSLKLRLKPGSPIACDQHRR